MPRAARKGAILGALRGLLFIILAGCYAPHPVDGAACSPEGACPSPLVCSRGTCVAHVTEPPDATGVTDARDAAGCTPVADGAGALSAPSFTPTIDGDLTEWTPCFIGLDSTTGVVIDYGAMNRFPSGRFSIAHDATHLYIAAEVQGVLPLGNHGLPTIYENNAISVYLDGDGSVTSSDYDDDAAQILVDHANRVQPYRNTLPVSLSHLASAAQADQATFTIELALEPSAFGLASFGPTVRFDLGFEAGDGTEQDSEVYWYQRCELPTCGCSDGTTSAPYCDARELGTVTLK